MESIEAGVEQLDVRVRDVRLSGEVSSFPTCLFVTQDSPLLRPRIHLLDRPQGPECRIGGQLLYRR